jgi:hypothetical protein
VILSSTQSFRDLVAVRNAGLQQEPLASTSCRILLYILHVLQIDFKNFGVEVQKIAWELELVGGFFGWQLSCFLH